MGGKLFQSLADQVFSYLKEKIINNDLKPGSILYIDKLAAEFGISTTPVREAIVKLEGLDLVTIQRNKSVIVSRMSREKILDVLEMRRLLETYGSRSAIMDITDEEIQNLEQILDKIIINPRNFDYYKYSDLELHETITKHIKNKEIRDSLKNLSIYSRRIRYYARYYGDYNPLLEESVIKITKEHQSILKALKLRDPEKLEEEIRKHLVNAEERTLKALDRKEKDLT